MDDVQLLNSALCRLEREVSELDRYADERGSAGSLPSELQSYRASDSDEDICSRDDSGGNDSDAHIEADTVDHEVDKPSPRHALATGGAIHPQHCIAKGC